MDRHHKEDDYSVSGDGTNNLYGTQPATVEELRVCSSTNYIYDLTGCASSVKLCIRYLRRYPLLTRSSSIRSY